MAAARVQAWPVPAGAWQAQLRTLVFGANTPYAFRAVDGLDLPQILDGDTERAQTDGMFGGIETTASRDLIFEMLVHPDMFVGSAKAVLVQALKAAFAESSDDIGLTLQHPDLGPLLFIGRPRRVSYKVDRSYPWTSQENVLAMFRALDPLIYSGTLQDITIPYGTAGTNAGLEAYGGGLLGASAAPRRIIQNGMFEETATTPWLTTANANLNGGATLTRDTGTIHDGAASGKLVTSGASSIQGVRQTSVRNVRPNTTYVFSVWVNLTTAGGLITAYILNDGEGGFTSSAVVSGTGVWTRISASLTTGPAPTTLSVVVRDEGTAVTRTFYVDSAQVEVGAVAGAVLGVPLMGVTAGAIGGGGGAAGFVQLVNNGTASTKPVSRIKALAGPVTGPLYLDRVESGESIVLNYNMASGDVLELDHDLHSVLLNGVANRADTLDPSTSWWSLAPGMNTIHYRTSGPGAGSQAEILYRDAYW